MGAFSVSRRFVRPKLVWIIDDDTGRRVGIRLWMRDSEGRHKYRGEIRWA